MGRQIQLIGGVLRQLYVQGPDLAALALEEEADRTAGDFGLGLEGSDGAAADDQPPRAEVQLSHVAAGDADVGVAGRGRAAVRFHGADSRHLQPVDGGGFSDVQAAQLLQYSAVALAADRTFYLQRGVLFPDQFSPDDQGGPFFDGDGPRVQTVARIGVGADGDPFSRRHDIGGPRL